MKELFEKTIGYILISEDKTTLAFLSLWGQLIAAYSANGDCCSGTWFESIINPENMIGSTINGIENKLITVRTEEEIRAIEKASGYEVLEIYGYTFKTDKGYAEKEYRNDSNGYYGGTCDLILNATITVENKEEDTTYVSTCHALKNDYSVYLCYGNEKILMKEYKENK